MHISNPCPSAMRRFALIDFWIFKTHFFLDSSFFIHFVPSFFDHVIGIYIYIPSCFLFLFIRIRIKDLFFTFARSNPLEKAISS